MRALSCAALCAVALLLEVNAGAPTSSETAACKPDAFKFCSPGLSDLFDHSRILACILQHKADLSPKCTDVIRKRGL